MPNPSPRRCGGPPVTYAAAWLALGAPLAPPAPVDAQTFAGDVVQAATGEPVATAIVSLLFPDDEVAAISIADHEGRYRLVAPRPGVYRLEAVRIGFDAVRTPTLEVRNLERIYSVDLVMTQAPIPIEGISVEVGPRQTERAIRRIIGLDPSSLRNDIIHYAEIQDHLGRGHDLADIVRWSNSANLVVYRTADGPCVSIRGSGCVPVYFNGFRLLQELTDALPLDMAHAISVLMPNESIAHPGGAVLVFSETWLR